MKEKRTTLTELRQNIYSVFDEVIKTNEPVYVERKGFQIKLELISNKKEGRLKALKKRKCVAVSDEILLNDSHWEWSEDDLS